MDKIIKKLFCWVLGHNYHPKIKDMYCVRCGTSRPKTAEEMGYTEPNAYFIGDIQINQWDDIEDATIDN